jgi:hypothetical protein
MKWWFRSNEDIERALAKAKQERAEVLREGRKRAPLINRLEAAAAENHFAERFIEALHQPPGRHA